jgi:DNA-binding PadR family transcriptional regulator
MELSARQQDFLSRLLDLYHKAQGPVHYSNVARALDVRPVTAYEMMRLLEDKGFVESETARPKGRRGRSLVVFSPTAKAQELLADLTGDVAYAQAGTPAREEAWEQTKGAILNALENGDGEDYQALLETLLLRIPERQSPLLFVADMVTATILTFYELRERAAVRRIFASLRLLGPPGWAVLYSLAGFSLALSLVEKANRSATTLLLSYARQFHEHLDHLSGGEKAKVSDFVYEILKILGL